MRGSLRRFHWSRRPSRSATVWLRFKISSPVSMRELHTLLMIKLAGLGRGGTWRATQSLLNSARAFTVDRGAISSR